MVNEMRKLHLELKAQRPEKQSPVLRTLRDFITGAQDRATPEAIETNYSKLTKAEKQSYRVQLKERYEELDKLVNGTLKGGRSKDGDYSLSDLMSARMAVAVIADLIALKLDSTQ